MWTGESLSKALNQSCPLEINATSVAIDNRNVQPGGIFIAIKGPNNDGHNFVEAAIKAGASCCIVESKSENQSSIPQIVVPDSIAALKALAVYARAKTSAKVIGVTGSVGKTSVKEMLRCALHNQGETYANAGNLNNHFGVPLTLANIPLNAEYVIIEMGMRAAGEIRELALLTKPDVAIITTVEAVHAEFFSSIAAIAHAKGEIMDGMANYSTIILNMDNVYKSILESIALSKKLKVIGFSLDAESDFKLVNMTSNDGILNIKAECSGKIIEYTIHTYGTHQVLNSLAVLAAVVAVGAEMEYAAGQLANFKPLNGRGAIHFFPNYNINLIDESYNASPASMIASLKAAALMKKNNQRIIAIIGDMRELGHSEIQMHENLANHIMTHNIDQVYTVGKLSKYLFDILPDNIAAAHFDATDKIAEVVQSVARNGDIILIKSSNSVNTKLVVADLVNHFGS